MKVLGLIGYPLGHSISPVIFNTCFKKLGMDYIYLPFQVPPVKLRAAIKGLDVLGMVGVNVTIPHKASAVRWLDEGDENVMITGSVNTIKFVDGRVFGYNTDVGGFLKSWEEETREKLKGKTAAIIGAGGAARSVAYALLKQKVAGLHFFVRKTPRANELIKQLSPGFPQTGFHSHRIEDEKTWNNLAPELDVIINATPVGMYPDIDSCPVKLPDNMKPGWIAYDLVYNPLRTKFLDEAQARKARVFGGLSMLIHQAALAYEIWFEQPAPIPLMKWAAWNVMKGKK
ncbi:MAG: shikimate dehydrogenase [Candidatus Eremiobacteraeota bacterium]|nr:shikimate dehydrogenase [Candidatus Eremiobacteraeota bacterium]